MEIIELNEQKRRCGYRKPGGKYLVGGTGWTTCCELPIHLHVCCACGAGIKQSGGFTWIQLAELLGKQAVGAGRNEPACKLCLYTEALAQDRVGLLWVGHAAYPSLAAFMHEMRLQGVSRRIGAWPRGLKVGVTICMLAYPNHIVPGAGQIFSCCRVEHVDYVLSGQESPEELGALDKQGYRLVRVWEAEEYSHNATTKT